jgi:small subunit ribosomal protein S13|tara:strand:+ start:3652 stop:3981 length:330 start_codon:yes stop_codon:yes gene_type:complete
MSINNNKLYSLKSFSKVYGVNSTKVKTLCQRFGLNPSNKDIKFKKKSNGAIVKSFHINEYDKNLKLQIRKNIKFLNQIRTYRGIRHHLKLPSRGQRTKTNAKTKKRFKV